MSAMLVVMTVRTVLKVPIEKAVPPCPSDVPATLLILRLSSLCKDFEQVHQPVKLDSSSYKFHLAHTVLRTISLDFLYMVRPA